MNFTAVYEPAAEGGYVAWLEEMPGVQTQGKTWRKRERTGVMPFSSLWLISARRSRSEPMKVAVG
jgi:hypothetical protein